MRIVNKLSKIVIPKLPTPKATPSKSHKLLTDAGIIISDNYGITLLALAQRSLRKLENILHKHMKYVEAQEICLPTLTPEHLLQKSGRSALPDIFKLKDRHDKGLVLSPTHEESITDFFASKMNTSSSQLPLRLYQISHKFRDERRPKFGLMRSKEFVMKDLYCFDKSEEDMRNTYNEVCKQYHQFFNELKIPVEFVESHAGDIGGQTSHEFHVLCDVGDDTLLFCNDCGNRQNSTLQDNVCKQCQSKNVANKKGIEVGHVFMLGTRYSDPLKASFQTTDNKSKNLEMSCYGLGLSRLMAAAVEVLSAPKEIRFPLPIVPYMICLITANKQHTTHVSVDYESLANKLYDELDMGFPDDVIMDDRPKETIGQRLINAKKTGFPFAVIAGKQSASDIGKVEVVNIYKDTTLHLNIEDVIPYIKKCLNEN